MNEPEAAQPRTTAFQQLSHVAKRVTMGTIMVSGFLIIMYLGPLTLTCLVLAVQVFCYKEILHIGHETKKVPPSLPLCWYFFVAANYFFFGETVSPYFLNYYKNLYYLQMIVKAHRFISFCIYFFGIVLFVLSLRRRKSNLREFELLAWTHTLLIIIVLPSYMIIANMFHGLIWLILPASLVILNDIFAFSFGRAWGRTPLIEVSPKKTWEGFIGGVVGTFISGLMISNAMCAHKHFICPIEYFDDGDGVRLITYCTPSYLFTPTDYSIINFYQFTYHFIAFALFASIIAPFAGFCASGFKRAFKVKDFGNVIPGHGGIMDRFDCQYLMAIFVNVYIFTFVRNPSVGFIFDKILYLDQSRQVQFYYMLRDSLQDNNILVD